MRKFLLRFYFSRSTFYILIFYIFSLSILYSTELLNNFSLPQFKDFPIHEKDRILKSSKILDLKSHVEGRQYRTVLRNGYKEKPNFAGQLIIVQHGCGTSCQVNWVINKKTGKIVDRFITTLGIKHKIDSNLLILNPVYPFPKEDLEEYRRMKETPYWAKEKTVYLKWDGEKFTKINEFIVWDELDRN